MTSPKAAPVRLIRRRRSNSDKFTQRLLDSARTNHEETRRERLQKRARVLADHDAAVREAYFYAESMKLMASAVPEDMTREEILDAASRVRVVRRRVIALKSDFRDRRSQIRTSGWEHAVLRMPRHRGVTQRDLGVIQGWSWHAPEMPSIGEAGVSHDLRKLMGGEIEDFLRYRDRIRRLDGRQSKHTQAELIKEIVALRDPDLPLERGLRYGPRLEYGPPFFWTYALSTSGGLGRFAVQRWQLTAGGDDELAATFDGQTIRKSRDRREKPAFISSKEFSSPAWLDVPSVRLAQAYLLWRDRRSLESRKPFVPPCRSLSDERGRARR